jgi:hypothetical protein
MTPFGCCEVQRDLVDEVARGYALAGGIRGPPRPRGRGRALVGKSRPEPREERVSALTGHDPLSIVLKRFHEPPAAIVADDAGRRVRPSPDVTPMTTTTAKQPTAVESCARRMMCSLWACVLIAPFAVSQCLGVPDPSGGVGVKAELPASGQCFCLIGRRLNKNTGPEGPTVSTPQAGRSLRHSC